MKSLVKSAATQLPDHSVCTVLQKEWAVNAKILKDAKFSMTLDLFDMCTEGLQQKTGASEIS